MEKKFIIVLNLLLFTNSLSLAIPLDNVDSNVATEQPQGHYAKELRDFCASNEHCSLIKNSVCTEEGCICPENYTEKDNSCVKRDGPFCFDNTDCEPVEGVEIACLLGACQSLNHFFSPENAANIVSYSAENLRDPCGKDEHCSVKNSVCTEEGCICPGNYTERDNSCVKRDGPFCFDNTDCEPVEGVEIACLLGACQSLNHFFSPENEANIVSYSAENLRDPCGKDEHCSVKNSVCTEEGCICPGNFTEKDNSCVEL